MNGAASGVAVTRRMALESDAPFLFALYAGVREWELAQTSWHAAQKQAFLEMQFRAQTEGYQAHYPDGVHEIIECGKQAAGRIWWRNGHDGLHILDITVAPEFRRRGIGSRVLGELIRTAGTKPVSIYVESFNPSLPLWERLGFELTEQDGFQLLLTRHAGHNSSGQT